MEANETLYKVAKYSDLIEGEGKVVHAGIKKLALFKIGGEIFCIQNNCPHAGGFLGMGQVNDNEVLCPRHCWRFDIKTGDCYTDPRYKAQTYRVKVDGDDVYVEVPKVGAIV